MLKREPTGRSFAEKFTQFYHPPLLPMPDVPVGLHYGAFMSRRKHTVHMGVDLYADQWAIVHAVEDGEVVLVRPFTGPSAGTPFWNDTMAVDVEGQTGIITYGEISIYHDGVKPGDKVDKGSLLGTVQSVLKEDKGKPRSMLHFAIHRHGWKGLLEGQQDPNQESFYDLQIDPTPLLLQMKAKADLISFVQSLTENLD